MADMEEDSLAMVDLEAVEEVLEVVEEFLVADMVVVEVMVASKVATKLC